MNVINLVRADNVEAMRTLVGTADYYAANIRPEDVRSQDMLEVLVDYLDFTNVDMKMMQWLKNIGQLYDAHAIYASDCDALRYAVSNLPSINEMSAIMNTALRLGCEDVAETILRRVGLESAVEYVEDQLVASWIAQKIADNEAWDLIDVNHDVHVAFRELNVPDFEPTIETHAVQYLTVNVTESLVDVIIGTHAYERDLHWLYDNGMWFNDTQRILITVMTGHHVYELVHLASIIEDVEDYDMQRVVTFINTYAHNIDLAGFRDTDAYKYLSSQPWFPYLTQ